ncbi:MAG: alpha/beta hydrolase, partial [Mesorhizobium sp.]
MGTLLRDGATLHMTDTGEGLAVVFQHGLGGGEAQVAQ